MIGGEICRKRLSHFCVKWQAKSLDEGGGGSGEGKFLSISVPLHVREICEIGYLHPSHLWTLLTSRLLLTSIINPVKRLIRLIIVLLEDLIVSWLCCCFPLLNARYCLVIYNNQIIHFTPYNLITLSSHLCLIPNVSFPLIFEWKYWGAFLIPPMRAVSHPFSIKYF